MEKFKVPTFDVKKKRKTVAAWKAEIDTLDKQLLQALADRTVARLELIDSKKFIHEVQLRVSQKQAAYDSLQIIFEDLRDENVSLIKKLEALEASLDTIAMAATAGLAVSGL